VTRARSAPEPRPVLPLHAALGLTSSGELVSIVGGGGKSTLLFALAERADAGSRWVLSTTTRIFASQIVLAPAHCIAGRGAAPDALARHLDAGVSGLLVVGDVEGDKAVGIPPTLPAEILGHPRVDGVAVEADGSRRLPAKAPATHEPVIAIGTTLTVVVAGLDALEGPIERMAHRPERVAAIVGTAPEERLTPTTLAVLLAHPSGGLKGVPASARVAVVLNKADTSERVAWAREAAALLVREPRIDRVLIGALHAPEPAFETWLAGA